VNSRFAGSSCGKIIARLKAYEDSWSALANFSDVLQKLAELDGTEPDVETVAEVLKSCGVVDATPRVSPYASRASCTQEDIEALAGVLTLFQNALDEMRELGRKVSGNVAWAAGVEGGKQLKTVVGIPQNLFDEMQKLVFSVQSNRTRLREAAQALPEFAEKYKDLLNPPVK
jgi:hypothetical protein